MTHVALMLLSIKINKNEIGSQGFKLICIQNLTFYLDNLIHPATLLLLLLKSDSFQKNRSSSDLFFTFFFRSLLISGVWSVI